MVSLKLSIFCLLILSIGAPSCALQTFNFDQANIFLSTLKLAFKSPMNVNIQLCWRPEEIMKLVHQLQGSMDDKIHTISVGKIGENLTTFDQFTYNSLTLMDLSCEETKQVLRTGILRRYHYLKWFFLGQDVNSEVMEAINRADFGPGANVFFTSTNNGSDLSVFQGKLCIS